MPIKDNQVVTINFILTDEEGTVIESTSKENPFAYLSGNEQILPKLEEEIGLMLIGSRKSVTLVPEDAYGVYDDAALQSVKKTEFPEDTELQEGMRFVANAPDGSQMPFVVKEIKGEDILLDFNHPLAGRTLTFDVELLGLRDATSEELSHGHVHGHGGHHH